MKIAKVLKQLEDAASSVLDLTGGPSAKPKPAQVQPAPVQPSGRSTEEVSEIVKLRRMRSALDAKFQRGHLSPTAESALLSKIDQINVELEALGHVEAPLAGDGGFFFRGGVSAHIDVADTNFENCGALGVAKSADVRKAEKVIDLDPNPMGTTTHGTDIASIDLSSLKL